MAETLVDAAGDADELCPEVLVIFLEDAELCPEVLDPEDAAMCPETLIKIRGGAEELCPEELGSIPEDAEELCSEVLESTPGDAKELCPEVQVSIPGDADELCPEVKVSISGDAEKLRPEVLRDRRLEGGPLGDEKRDKRLARWSSRLGLALGGGGRRTGTGNGISLGDEKRRERSARRAEEDWSQGNKIGSAEKDVAGPWNGVGSAGRSGCPSIVSQFGFWASQAKKVALSTPFG